MTATERKSDLELTTNTPYFTLTGELWGVYYEKFEENWPGFNATTMYNFTSKNKFCPIRVNHEFSPNCPQESVAGLWGESSSRVSSRLRALLFYDGSQTCQNFEEDSFTDNETPLVSH